MIEIKAKTIGTQIVAERIEGDIILGRDATIASWHGPNEPPTLEKITGLRSTLLPIHFLQRGIAAARSVARVVFPDRRGTGFVLEDNLLVTNHHVIPDRNLASSARVEFNYQLTEHGADETIDTAFTDPDRGFATSEDDDLTVVRLRGDVNARWGALNIAAKTSAVDDPVNIIQHPGGGPKHIALYHNHIVYIDARIIQYLTDTLPGSSGSPVFNDDWAVVAVHHAGGLRTPMASKTTFCCNEGIRIERLLQLCERL